MVLLDLMSRNAMSKKYDLVVAHFDHGLRDESDQDCEFVRRMSKSYGLLFVTTRAILSDSSEQTSRSERHAWLSRICTEQKANAVITAHHADDLIETSLLNLARGSLHRGLAPMQGGRIPRPLLGVSRNELRQYARGHNIEWREDPTNQNTDNPRNFLRHVLLAHADDPWRTSYLELISQTANLNQEILRGTHELVKDFRKNESEYLFPRNFIKSLSLLELEEVLAYIILKLDPDAELDKRILSEISLFLKTSKPHRVRPIRKGLEVVVDLYSAKVMRNQ